MKKITDFDVNGKRVFLRCDFNIGLDKNGAILDDFRIAEAVPTIEYLLKNNAKIILASHLGKPLGKIMPRFSLSIIQEKLLEYLDCSIVLAPNSIGQELVSWTNTMSSGEILLLENLRFHPQEKANSRSFAKDLSSLADIYINEAFSVSHRKHASIIGIPEFLPSGIGFLFSKEIEMLKKITKNSKHCLIGIIGGAKLKSKIGAIKNLLEKVDFLLIGGKVSNAILRKQKAIIGEVDSEIDLLLKDLDLSNLKMILPKDVVVSCNGERKIKPLSKVQKNDMVFDIGPKTIEVFLEKIKTADTIFWAGPLGNIEENGFEKGCIAIARAIGESKAFSLAGGGDILAFLKKENLKENFNYLSTGGGAMLIYLSNGTLPGINAIEK